MPDSSAVSDLWTAAAGAVSVLLGVGATSWSSARRERSAQRHQLHVEEAKRVFESGERRFERRIDATRSLVTELRRELKAADDFEERNGHRPGEVYDDIAMPEALALLTDVELLCPDEVVAAARKAVDSTSQHINLIGPEHSSPEEAIRELVDIARRVFDR